MQILVTGGTGYIGSHTVVSLLNADHDVVVVDNLSNSKLESLNRLRKICGRPIPFYQCDIRSRTGLVEVFSQHEIDAVIHFAGLKAVGESVSNPLVYYRNNVAGSLALFQVMAEQGVKKLVFSSSATVYGEPDRVPITETFPLKAMNPYGRTKLMIEEILRDVCQADGSWSVALLRYFNPVGAHPSGLIGEDPNDIPNNLMPYISQVAVGKLPYLNVFGNDYPTPDGTGVRDYIHVVDLADGHLKALNWLAEKPGIGAFNLGTGKGVSVLELVKAFENAAELNIPVQMAPRRPGDAAVVYADPSKAAGELNWRAEKSLHDMCADAWRWQSENPDGFAG